MATYKPKKKIDNNGTLDDIKFPMDSVDGLADEFKKKGVHFISDSDITVTSGSSSLSEKWVINGVDGTTEPFDGMVLTIKTPTHGAQKGVVLSIDGGATYHPLVITGAGVSSLLFQNYYTSETTVTFVYNSSKSISFVYLEDNVATTMTGCWTVSVYYRNDQVNQSGVGSDKEYPVLTRSTDSVSGSKGAAFFSSKVTINPSTGTLSAFELKENGVSLADKYALKDEVGGGKITQIDEDPDNITDVEVYDRFISYKSTAYVEYEDETYSLPTTINYLPIGAGENIKFDVDSSSPDKVKISTDLPTVKAKLTPASEVGGGSWFDNLGNIDTWMDLPYDIEVAGIDGVSWNEAYVFQDKDGNIIASGDMAHRIPLQAGDGIELEQDNENNIVKINSTVEVPTATSQLENDSDFATKSDINALIAKTEQEFNSLITIENAGKTISYDGKLYLVKVEELEPNPPQVGDVITGLYFNTDIEPNFSDFVFEDGGAGLLITDTNPTTGMLSLLTVFEVTEESFGAGTPNGYALAIQHDGKLRTLYATEDYDVGNIHASKGWNVDKFELGWSATIQAVLQQEKWGTFISKTPFNKEIFAKEVGGADFEDVAHLDNHYTSVYVDENCIAFDGISELEDENGTAFSFSGSMQLPITAGEGIEFEPDAENNVVKINATGGGGGGISGAWTSGTSGSIALPSAGTYQIKSIFSSIGGMDNATVSSIVYWDGISQAVSPAIFRVLTSSSSFLFGFFFLVEENGVIQSKALQAGSSPLEMSFQQETSYRKIGEA